VRFILIIERRYFDSLLKLVEAVGCDYLARLKTLHGCVISIRYAYRDTAQGGGLIGLDQIHERALGISLDGRRGNNCDSTQCIDQQAGIHELTGKERIIFVREDGS
jgi:hypothetical protein